MLIPARVKEFGSNRCIRLVVESGLPIVRMTPPHTHTSTGPFGLVDPHIIYNPFNRLPSSMLEHVYADAPHALLQREYRMLGHTEKHAARCADAAKNFVNPPPFDDFEDVLSATTSIAGHPVSAEVQMRREMEASTKEWKRMVEKGSKIFSEPDVPPGVDDPMLPLAERLHAPVPGVERASACGASWRNVHGF